MSRRTNIINSLIQHITNNTQTRGFRGLRFLHEVNDFPCFYVHPQSESRTHIAHEVKLAIISCDVRGYVYSDALNDTELFARTLETAIQTFAKTHLNLVDECRVTTLRTDEGLMHPYGIVDLTLDILYRIE